MRLPNGYGSVYKLSGNRRRPFIVRKTIGVDFFGAQQYETIGYYTTKAAALLALAEYNKDPYEINSMVTFAEVFYKWKLRKFGDEINSNVRAYEMAYRICKPLHNLNFTKINTDHLQEVINTCNKKYDTLRKVKVLLNQLFDYGMEKDIVKKNYAEYIQMPANDEESTRAPFTPKELDLLWANIDRLEIIDLALIMIYTGFRPNELLTIESANINFEEQTIKGGSKTKAGKNRIVPISSKILPLIKNRLQPDAKYLVTTNKGEQMKYNNFYRDKWIQQMDQLQLNHKPHDCRHTFATLMDNAGANKLAIKRIMGHASADITDKIYTHKDIEELKKAIDLI